ncbi:MAG: hypothetical protein ACREQR_06155 [Candidatus Binataceae bacterium]
MVFSHRSEGTPSPASITKQAVTLWLATLRRYLFFVLDANFVWEILQLPTFADWREGGWRWLTFIVAIGTAGDVAIAATSLVFGLVVFGDERWPAMDASYWRVAVAASVFGLGYTTYSEWRHAVVLRDWTYSALMPVVPGLGVGVFPLLQWILIPAAAFYYARAGFRDALH